MSDSDLHSVLTRAQVTADPEPVLVSVVCCAYNAGAYLMEAVESILVQTHPRIELIVIDDGSNDGSTAFLADRKYCQVRLIHQENAGKPAALNRALSEMKGDFYAIQDADDTSYPDRIELQLRRMLEEPDLAAVFSGHDLILDGRRCAPRFRPKSRETCKENIKNYSMPAHDPTAMYRVELVRDLKYDHSFRIGQGYDYILRVGEKHPMVVLAECLYSYRIHSTSVTKGNPQERIKMVRELIRRACERRGEDFDTLFPESKEHARLNRVRDNSLATDFMESVVDLRSAGRWRDALSTGLICAGLHPFDPFYYRALLFFFLPTAIRQRVRHSERRSQAAKEHESTETLSPRPTGSEEISNRRRKG